MKPGWKTTEFAFTVATLIISVLVSIGVVATSDAETLTTAIRDSIVAASSFLTSATVIWRYINSRTEVKKEELRLK